MKPFLNSQEEQSLVKEIHAYESRTTGEIRIVITSKWILRPQRYAWEMFHHLGMSRTADRNAALVIVFACRRRFVILGDEALAAVVGADYWENLANSLSQHLREGQPLLALTTGIRTLGETLASHWPSSPDNLNELPNQIIHD